MSRNVVGPIDMEHEPVNFQGQRHPDPVRAHGAWIFLFASVAAGALVGTSRRIEPSMLVGTGFVGAFLAVAAISVGLRRKKRQFLTGASLAVIAPVLALALGANPNFLVLALCTIVPAVSSVLLARSLGVLARPVLITGIAALAFAAPVVALAGDASIIRAALAFGFLWPFFCWRTLVVAAPLSGGAAWDRQSLRTQGLREAAVAGGWSLCVALCLRLASVGKT